MYKYFGGKRGSPANYESKHCIHLKLIVDFEYKVNRVSMDIGKYLFVNIERTSIQLTHIIACMEQVLQLRKFI